MAKVTVLSRQTRDRLLAERKLLRESGLSRIAPDNVRENRLLFYNDSGETVPAFAAMRVTTVMTVGGRSALRIKKPPTAYAVDIEQETIVFNSQREVPHQKVGVVQTTDIITAKCATSGVGSGTICGVAGWNLVNFPFGLEVAQFRSLGKITTDRCYAEQMPLETGAYFRTPAGGIPAAVSASQPSKAFCERMRFNIATESIIPYSPPWFLYLFNSVLGAIPGNITVQAKRIDGHWKTDVVDCNQG